VKVVKEWESLSQNREHYHVQKWQQI